MFPSVERYLCGEDALKYLHHRRPLKRSLEVIDFLPRKRFRTLRFKKKSKCHTRPRPLHCQDCQARCQSISCKTFHLPSSERSLPHIVHGTGLAPSNRKNAISVHSSAGLSIGHYPIFGKTLLSCQYLVSVLNLQ